MKFTKLPLDGLVLVELKAFADSRGYFSERYKSSLFKEAGINEPFSQDNFSRSKPGVLRGLHYQTQPTQGKLVSVTRGAVWDVAVDIRKNSKTFGQYYGTELSDQNHRMLWIPHGFAHGFCVLGKEDADVFYKVTGEYNPKGDSGLRWNDPQLKIEWPQTAPIVSEKDQLLPWFKEIIPL